MRYDRIGQLFGVVTISMFIVICITQGCSYERYEITQTIDKDGTYLGADSVAILSNQMDMLFYNSDMEEYKEALLMGEDAFKPRKPRLKDTLMRIYHKTTVITEVRDNKEFENIYLSEVKYDEKLIKAELRKAKNAIITHKERLQYLKDLLED